MRKMFALMLLSIIVLAGCGGGISQSEKDELVKELDMLAIEHSVHQDHLADVLVDYVDGYGLDIVYVGVLNQEIGKFMTKMNNMDVHEDMEEWFDKLYESADDAYRASEQAENFYITEDHDQIVRAMNLMESSYTKSIKVHEYLNEQRN